MVGWTTVPVKREVVLNQGVVVCHIELDEAGLGEVSGYIFMDGNPVKDARVYLMVHYQYKHGKSDHNGFYTFTEVPSGETEVTVTCYSDGNRTLFELENQPESLAVIGAGYIALELAQAYHRFGTKVKLIHRSERVLSTQTSDISDELTKHLSDEGIEIHLNTKVKKISRTDENTILITAEENGKEVQFRVSHILIAAGIDANTANLGLEILGVNLDKAGSVIVNEKQETNIGHVYAIGDCTNTPSFVYTAAAEGKTAALNAIMNKDATMDYQGLPWVVFTDPQVAGAGIDEKEAIKEGIPYETSTVYLKDVPRSIAARDTRGFIKLIRNTETDELLGIRVVAPEGGELVMQASLAIKYGIKVEEIANSLHPYLTLSEGVKLASITFKKDIKELSCCAV